MNKDFLPSSSPISSICTIEIEAILFLFMMNCYKSSFQECIAIIVLKMERTRNCLPRSGCLGTPLTLPQSLYQTFSDQQVTKFAYPWCSASSTKNKDLHILGDPGADSQGKRQIKRAKLVQAEAWWELVFTRWVGEPQGGFL